MIYLVAHKVNGEVRIEEVCEADLPERCLILASWVVVS